MQRAGEKRGNFSSSQLRLDDDDDCWILPKFIGTCFSGCGSRHRKHWIYVQIGHGQGFELHTLHFPHILVITTSGTSAILLSPVLKLEL